jgi:glyoxylase-like metal-dependent hydrolase (beta-lactamase superfamily II)
MLSIEQYRYGEDNLAYLIYGKKRAMAIDGGAWADILEFLSQNDLVLDYVVNTHDHYDHTSGNDELTKRKGKDGNPSCPSMEHREMEHPDFVRQRL